MRVTDSATFNELNQNGQWDMQAFRGGQAFALPFTNVTGMAPLTKNYTAHREGDKARVLLDFEKQLVDIVTQYRDTFDAAKRKDLMKQYNKIFTENVYNLGVFVGRYGLGLTKRAKNVPDGTPVFMYTWVEDAVLLDMLWTPKDQQLKQNRPDTIPVYK
jgi:peptide/nickel transport system substrate-binding protein